MLVGLGLGQIRQGSGAMPPHGHLSAADVEALVEYLKTL
jgi:hypothetical protein